MRHHVGNVWFKVFQRFRRIDATDESPLLPVNSLIRLCEQVKFAPALKYAIPAAFAEFRSRALCFVQLPLSSHSMEQSGQHTIYSLDDCRICHRDFVRPDPNYLPMFPVEFNHRPVHVTCTTLLNQP